MKHFIPDSKQHAQSVLTTYITLNSEPRCSPEETLLKMWSCIAYLHQGLHPDEVDSPDGGWPSEFLPYANEIWSRHGKGEINDEALYPSDAQWAGLCDQLDSLTPEESKRRQQLRDSMAGEPLHAHFLDQIDTKEAMGRISAFLSYRDADGPYEQWCGEWFNNFEAAERHRQQWAQRLYEESMDGVAVMSRK